MENGEATEEEVIAGLMRFAAEGVVEGKSRTQVAEELETLGVPQEVATAIVDRVSEYKTEVQRREGGKSIGCGLLMLIVGGIVTAATYAAAEAGGVYFVTIGLFIAGGLALLRGLYQWFMSYSSDR